MRLNSWAFVNKPEDLCTLKCALNKVGLVNQNGDLKVETLKFGKLDMTPLKVKNINADGFVESVAAFIDLNRSLLVQELHHQEAAAAVKSK